MRNGWNRLEFSRIEHETRLLLYAIRFNDYDYGNWRNGASELNIYKISLEGIAVPRSESHTPTILFTGRE